MANLQPEMAKLVIMTSHKDLDDLECMFALTANFHVVSSFWYDVPQTGNRIGVQDFQTQIANFMHDMGVPITDVLFVSIRYSTLIFFSAACQRSGSSLRDPLLSSGTQTPRSKLLALRSLCISRIQI